MSEKRTGEWMQSFLGVAIYPLDPRPEEIQIVDIAHALGMLCRFNGHTTKFYSVAEHSVAVSNAVPPEFALWGLLHDASEAFLCDVPRPLKPYLPGYYAAEAAMQRCIIEKFGLEWPEPKSVKEMDERILANEKAIFLNDSLIPWSFIPEPIAGLTLVGWSPDEAKQKFLDRYDRLCGFK